jgi:hypothetical protein
VPSNPVTLQNDEVALVANTATTVIAAGVSLSAAMVYNKDAAAVVYVTDDGSAPSATHGMSILPQTGYEWPPHALPQAAVRVFSTGTPRVFSRWA